MPPAQTARTLSEVTSEMVSSRIFFLSAHTGEVSPLDTGSLQRFGDLVLQECIELCLRTDPRVPMNEVDRAECLRKIIVSYVDQGRDREARGLFARAQESRYFNGISSRGNAAEELSLAQRKIEQGPSQRSKWNDSVRLRNSFIDGILCATDAAATYIQGPKAELSPEKIGALSFVSLKAIIPGLDDETCDAMANRFQALAMVEDDKFVSGFERYLTTRPPKRGREGDLENFTFESQFASLINYALACGAPDKVILTVVPAIRECQHASSIQRNLSARALTEGRIDDAVLYAETISFNRDRPAQFGEIASALFSQGKETGEILVNGLQRALRENTGFSSFDLSGSDLGAFQIQALTGLGHALCER